VLLQGWHQLQKIQMYPSLHIEMSLFVVLRILLH